MGRGESIGIAAVMLAGGALEAGCGPSEQEATEQRQEVVDRAMGEMIDTQAAKVIKQDYGVDVSVWKGRTDLSQLDLSILRGLEENTGWSRARRDLAPQGYHHGDNVRVPVPKGIDEENFLDHIGGGPDGFTTAKFFNPAAVVPDFSEEGDLRLMGEIKNILDHNVSDLTGEDLRMGQGLPGKFKIDLDQLLLQSEHGNSTEAMVASAKQKPYDPVYAMEPWEHGRVVALFEEMDQQGALAGSVYREEIGHDLITLEDKGLVGIGIDPNRSYRFTDLSPTDGKILVENEDLVRQAREFLWREQKVANIIGDTKASQRAELLSTQLKELVVRREGTLLTDSLHGADYLVEHYVKSGSIEDATRVAKDTIQEVVSQLDKGVDTKEGNGLVYKAGNVLKSLPAEHHGALAQALMEAGSRLASKDGELALQTLYYVRAATHGTLQEEAGRRMDALSHEIYVKGEVAE